MLTANACRQAAQALRLTIRADNPHWDVVVEDALATLARFRQEETERNKKILRENPRYGARTIKDNERACADLESLLRDIATVTP